MPSRFFALGFTTIPELRQQPPNVPVGFVAIAPRRQA